MPGRRVLLSACQAHFLSRTHILGKVLARCAAVTSVFYAHCLSDDCLYTRLNLELKFKWSNEAVQMDTKDPGPPSPK